MTHPQESQPESFLQKAESISHIVQALAILAAGFWAFYTFIYEDRIKPASEPPITSITTSLTPVGKKGPLIAIQAKTQLRNIGKVRIRLLADTFNVIGVTVQTGKSEEKHSGYLKSNLYSKEVKSQVLMKSGELLKGATANPNASYYLDPDESVNKDFIIYLPDNKFDLIRMKSVFVITKNFTRILPIKLVQITPAQSQTYQGQLLLLEDAPCPNEPEPCYTQNEATAEISLWK
ncbi:MAG: hypothetical protein H7Y37_08485 [Anaerolineae bacterium]|nr:hypothetical protein [Gloeobacterales cyanobacterium ES-bin-313]